MVLLARYIAGLSAAIGGRVNELVEGPRDSGVHSCVLEFGGCAAQFPSPIPQPKPAATMSSRYLFVGAGMESAFSAAQKVSAACKGLIATLTPGDFAAVGRRAGLLALRRDPTAHAAMLAEECALKKGRSRPIGFRARETTPPHGEHIFPVVS
jgi:hypothetical protein